MTATRIAFGTVAVLLVVAMLAVFFGILEMQTPTGGGAGNPAGLLVIGAAFIGVPALFAPFVAWALFRAFLD